MKTARAPAFDHGAALRVPSPHDHKHWTQLCRWLGEDGQIVEPMGHIRVFTASGWAMARPGDWIVLSVTGEFHVTHAGIRGLNA
jgi:hypothetical protein